MKYKLMAVDIDGTLLDSENILRDATIEAIRQAVAKGLIFTIATGRPIQGVEQFNARLGLDLPFITYNGAMVVMGTSREILYERCLSFDDAKRVYELGQEYGTTVIVWSKNLLYVNQMNERALKYGEMAKTKAVLISDVDTILRAGASKILWYDEMENINRFEAEVGNVVGSSVNFHTSKPIFLEFVDKAASKAIAMEKLGEHFGIRREEMIAVGDGDNDLSMIEYAGLGVAMGNAKDNVKSKADYITLSNDENGVAHVIYEFILK
jgi:Cof subfamily protein (haloacid dehalogenase superfamily)